MKATQELAAVSHELRMGIENGFLQVGGYFSNAEMGILVFL
jgi:hypothetical protein